MDQRITTQKKKKMIDSLLTLFEFCRHYVGEDLDTLTLRELQSVEQQIDTALKRIRSKKVKN